MLAPLSLSGRPRRSPDLHPLAPPPRHASTEPASTKRGSSRAEGTNRPWHSLKRTTQLLTERNQLADIASKLAIQNLDEWYAVTKKQIISHGGGNLLRNHHGLVSAVVKDLVDVPVGSDHKWKDWKFERAHPSFWNPRENQRAFLLDIEQRLGIKDDIEDWYKIKKEQLIEVGAEPLLRRYNSSISNMLTSVFSDRDWIRWKFPNTSETFWDSADNVRRFLQYVYSTLEFKSREEYYKLSVKQIAALGGAGLTRRWKNIYSILKFAYPQEEWLPWKSSWTHRDWWADKSNQLVYFEWLRSTLGLDRSLEDLYRLKYDDILKHSGTSLLAIYDSSPSAIVSALYPDHKWIPWKFTAAPVRFWTKHENRLAFLEAFRKEKGLDTLEGFYSTLLDDVRQAGGAGLLNRYGTSLGTLLVDVYPKHKWLPWMFTKSANNWWKARKNQIQYLEWLRSQLHFTKMDDLYSLSNLDLINHKGSALLAMYSSSPTTVSIVHQILAFCYPNHNWDPSKFRGRQAPAKQADLAAFLVQTLPKASTDLQYSVKLSELATQLANGQFLELDIYLKDSNLAFEYQGQKHFFDTQLFGEYEDQLDRDVQKAFSCMKRSVTLVEVPFWWTKEAFRQTLATVRKDLEVNTV